MSSILAIVNAKRVWKGAAAVEPSAASSYPAGVDAVLVEGGLITFIGSTKEVQERYARLTAASPPSELVAAAEGGRPRAASHRCIDCKGLQSVYPGFIDSHVHFLDGGRTLLMPDLSMVTTKAQFIATVRAFLETRYEPSMGRWIYGGGWSEAVVGTPTREWLDAVSTEVCLIMYSKDVHSCVMNTPALQACHVMAGANEGAPLLHDVEGGRIERDAQGVPTGVLRDNAMSAAKKFLPPADQPAGQRQALEAASDYLLSLGFTSCFSMMSTRFRDNISELKFLAQMETEGVMRIRVRYGVPLDDVQPFIETFVKPMQALRSCGARTDALSLPFRFSMTPPAAGGGYLLLGAVKLFSDGSLSSKTAAMNRPFDQEVRTDGDIDSDMEDAAIASLLREKSGAGCQCGLLTMTRLELHSAIHAAHSHDLQCVVHAIGDRAVATVNKSLCKSGDWLQSSAEEEGVEEAVRAFRRDPRSRVEHFQHVANVAKEVARMASHRIIASMQPCHLLFDGDYVDAMLGRRRKGTSYIWGTLLKAGIRVDLGSDWPVAPAHVNDGLRGAVTRVPDVMTALVAEQQAAAEGPEAEAAAKALKRYHETWTPAECISMDEALRTYTYEAAYGMFMEDCIGSLEAGKYADITIWSDDFLDDSRMEQLRGVEGVHARWWPRGKEPHPAYTIVGGIVEYEKQ